MNSKVTIISFAIFWSVAIHVNAQKIKVSYNLQSQKEFSGNVFLFLSKENRNPKNINIGNEPLSCFRNSVKNIKQGQEIIFDDTSVSYPVKLSELERGIYFIQAVWDNNTGGRAIGDSPDNIYNESIRINLSKDFNQTFKIVCDKEIPEPQFTETKFTKELRVNSELLSQFHGKKKSVNAAILLPADYYEKPEKKFPVLFYVFGFSGDYHLVSGREKPNLPIDSTSCITVLLDGACQLGHSVYANSDNNGPWGDALVKEFIPELEKQFRCNGVRVLNGHSSGGWSVLWLQTHYPQTFTACWSSSPDPVDFNNFQKVNLYKDTNMFYEKDSALRMVSMVGGVIGWNTMKLFYQTENVIYRGEQMHSFDAVFSQKNDDGTPRELCDSNTGLIDPETVENWKKYDIALYLKENWRKLEPDLLGKIRITVGEQDNFLLNYSVHSLEDELKNMNTGILFEYYPGDHFTVLTDEYYNAGDKFLEQKCLEKIHAIK